MMLPNASRQNPPPKSASLVGHLVYWFSLYAVPVGIVIATLLTLFLLTDRYPNALGTPIEIRALADPENRYAPQTAVKALSTLPATLSVRATSPTWLQFDVSPGRQPVDSAVEISTPLAGSLTCWDARTLAQIGRADRVDSTGALRVFKQGFALTLQHEVVPVSVLCHVTVVQTSTLSAVLWSVPDLVQSASRFDRGVGLLEGGLLTISLFVLVIAVTNREWIFLLLAAWLIGNLRLGAYAMGWDTQWLGRNIPLDWMPFIRQVTIASYYLLTYTLLTQLFDKGRVRRFVGLLRIAQWGGLILLLGAFLLPGEWFHPLMWLVCGYGIALTVILLSRMVYRGRSKVGLWHVVSLSMALCVMLSGILLVIFGRTEFINAFNGVIALLLSSIMVALAVAERIREERRKRIRAQTELVSNYAITPIGMFTLDLNGVFERANPVLENMLGFRANDENEVRWTDYFEPQDWQRLARSTEQGKETEIKLLDTAVKPGMPQHFVVRVTTEEGRVEGSLQDVTARTQTINRLRFLADNDPLTEVLNRRGIEKALDQSLQQMAEGLPCALAYLDLDHFKRINGLFGHTAGDEVLKQVCEKIKAALTEAQSLGRIGGDEFVILFPNATAAAATELASKVIKELNATPFHVGNRAFYVKSAMGVVEVSGNMSAKDAISAASRACRDARKQHQDIVVYEHDSNALQEHTEELRLFDELEGGDSPRGLYLEMQPIMSLNQPSQTLNFEVLLRVKDSTGNLIPSGKIVASAEESGTITIIDKWVFSATLEWLSKHEQRLPRTSFVSVNLSGVSLNDDKFVDAFFAILEKHEHLTHKLCVEITEGVALQGLDRTRHFIKRLQAMGARIALDDFGAGYTSFSYLKELRADAIKIDGALVKDMLANETNIAIVRTIVELARNLDMLSIAEWVEDCETLETLKTMGVDYVQGFAIAKALSPALILNAHSITDLVFNHDTLAFIERNA